VTYVFMAVHYPAHEGLEEVHASMTQMAASLTGTPGLLEIGPWVERDGSRVVGISRWESKAAFDAVLPGSGVPSDAIHTGERKRREYFHLETAAEGSPGGKASRWHDLAPELYSEPYVYAIVTEIPGGIAPFAVIREDEGITVVMPQADADRAGLRYDYVAARISLRLSSDLAAVGLTAAVSHVLADAGISCNVIAGGAHDHFLTDWDRGEEALALLRAL
jgi:heme-degrading monooxygenase HmoA